MKALVALLLLWSACDRAKSTKPGPTPTLADPGSSSATAPPAAMPCKLDAIAYRYPEPKRLVAIGDIHGDLAAAKSALRAAGAIGSADDHWIGDDLVIVQTGDILDRGNDEKAIVDLFSTLETEAAAKGGAVIVLNGNHELMNALGDFRYVTPGGMHDFDADGGRDKALAPGGTYAKKFAKHNAIAIVGDTIFSHAGVLGDWVTQIESVNNEARCFLDGQNSKQPPASMASEDSPLWTRDVGMPDVDCAIVEKALAALKLKRMVVGHTVQKEGVNGKCGDTLWRIDVGLAKLYDGPIQVLQVVPSPKILTGTR